MPKIADVADFLETFAPRRLAEDWDNVGLLVGDRRRELTRVMTCLTITPDCATEAVAERAELIVAHHPLPFRPLKRLTADEPEGRLLLDLIEAGVSIYSPHTAFDSTTAGINQRFATALGLKQIAALKPLAGDPQALGAGRFGQLAAPESLAKLCQRVKQFLKLDVLQIVGPPDRPVQQVGVACGSAGEFLSLAAAVGCQAFVTGEARFHTCLEAEARDVALILTGHYASERFAVEALAEVLAEQFPPLTIWASRRECDPLCWV